MESHQQQKQLPRFFKGFIGKGHQLEQKRRKRRNVELEERTLANRVIFLEKQQIKAKRSLLSKRQQLQTIIKIAERQSKEKQKKQKLLIDRQKQIQISRQQNRLRRIFHKQNQDKSVEMILERNSLDYKISKKTLQECEKRKNQERLQHLTERRERYMTLNLKRQEGRSRIDKFFKDKNRQHAQLYEEKIRSQQNKTRQKLRSIKRLQQFEQTAQKRLQQSSLRVSKIQEMIENMSNTVKKRSASRSSLDLSSQIYNNPTLITSIQGQLLSKRQNTSQSKERQPDVYKIRKRRNSQIHRFNQYEIF